MPTTDFNVAITSHALGSLAARLWRAGEPLWWNSYEGVGAPLAGDMQAAALFPPTLLLAFSKGQLLEHLLFQIVSGLATYALLRQLGAARLAGVAFAFNGVFAWLANAAVKPICLLPVLLLLGVEMLTATPPARSRKGGPLIAVGIAGSLYAGFPEVAYLNGLLVGLWTIVCATALARAEALRFVAAVALFGLCGLLLAAPLLTAVASYMQVADVGLHGSEIISSGYIDRRFAALLFLPYLSGTLFHEHYLFWANTGCYAGVSLAVLAIAGAAGREYRRLRYLLAGWVIACLGATFGVPPFLTLFHLLPMTRLAALHRYLDSSWLFAMSVLAGLAIGNLASGRASPRRLGAALGADVFVVAMLGLLGWTGGVRLSGSVALAICALQLVVMLVILAAAGSRLGGGHPAAGGLIALAAAAEIMALFAVPTLSHPRATPVELGGVRFL